MHGGGLSPQTDSDTKLLYCWMLRLSMSEQGPRTRSKRGRSSLTHFRGPRATTVAARGRFISRAISPGGRRHRFRNRRQRGERTRVGSYRSNRRGLISRLQQTPRFLSGAAKRRQNPKKKETETSSRQTQELFHYNSLQKQNE